MTDDLTDAATDTSAAPLLHDTHDGVATLTLNRPDSLNSLSDALKVVLRDTLAELATDPGCRAIVLTGAGKAFCVGQDLREHMETLESGGTDLFATVTEHYNPIVRTLAGMPKPVVAAVRGMAAGAGASLSFLADLRVGGPGTRFLLAFANVGLAADTGASWTLPRLVGYAKAAELLLLATPVNADEAARIRLLTELMPDDEQVLPRAQELAAQLAAGPTAAYGQIRRQLAIGASGTLEDALRTEYEAQASCGVTHDHREATYAFVEKRQPTFTGR